MFPLPWYAALLIAVPQMFLIIKIGFGLFNMDINQPQVWLTACISAFMTYLIRMSPIIPGLHTVIIALLTTVVIVFVTKKNFWHSLVAILLGVMILGVLEGVWLPILLAITHSDIVDLILHPWLNILGFMPIIAVAGLLYWFIWRNHFVLFDLEKLESFHEEQ